MSYQNKIGVIVLGGHVQGYGIVRVFGEESIPSIVIDKTKNNIAKHSKYCEKFYESSYNDLLVLFKKFIKEEVYKNWAIFPTDDYYVKFLSKNKEELNKYFKVTVDEWSVINNFYNKVNSYPIANKLGVPIPNTFYPQNEEELNDIEINYPCIIKPAVMKDFYSKFKKKVFVCTSKLELIDNYRRSVEFIKSNEILIQEIIPGNAYNQYSVGMFFDRNKSINSLVAKRCHQHPLDFGNATTYAETVDLPILISYAEKILSEVNYFGLCEVEFKYDERDGLYKFLEVNPRTWKWHLISKIAGIPFLKSMFDFLLEKKAIVKKDYKIVGWRDFATDYFVSLQMIIKGMYKKRSRLEVIEAVFNVKDIKPFLWQLIYIPYNFLKR